MQHSTWWTGYCLATVALLPLAVLLALPHITPWTTTPFALRRSAQPLNLQGPLHLLDKCRQPTDASSQLQTREPLFHRLISEALEPFQKGGISREAVEESLTAARRRRTDGVYKVGHRSGGKVQQTC